MHEQLKHTYLVLRKCSVLFWSSKGLALMIVNVTCKNNYNIILYSWLWNCKHKVKICILKQNCGKYIFKKISNCFVVAVLLSNLFYVRNKIHRNLKIILVKILNGSNFITFIYNLIFMSFANQFFYLCETDLQ